MQNSKFPGEVLGPCFSPGSEASVSIRKRCSEGGYFEELVPAAQETLEGCLPVTFSPLVMLSSSLALSTVAVCLYLSAVCFWLYFL